MMEVMLLSATADVAAWAGQHASQTARVSSVVGEAGSVNAGPAAGRCDGSGVTAVMVSTAGMGRRDEPVL